MKHRHHMLLSIGRSVADGHLIKFRSLSCAEHDARYAGPEWRFFPSHNAWFIAWKKKAKA